MVHPCSLDVSASTPTGSVQDGYDAYRKAWDLKQSSDIRRNLGNVEVELGKPRDAAEHLSYCLKRFPSTGSAEQ